MDVSFFMPDAAKALPDYRIEFDTYFSPTVGTGGTGGLAVIGTNRTLATFYVPAGSSGSKSKSNKLYLGGTNGTEIATFSTYQRGTSPDLAEAAQYWTHVTLVGDRAGVFMTAVQANGSIICEGLRLSDNHDALDVIYLREYTAAGNYNAYLDIDDVAVWKAVTNEFEWTGGGQTARWEDPANWSVGGAPTLFFPKEGDTVSVMQENLTVLVTSGTEFGRIKELAGSVRFSVLFSEEGQTFAVPTGKIDAGRFSVAPPFGENASFSEGVWTAGERTPTNFVRRAAAGKWHDCAGWTVGGEETGACPTAQDQATFGASADVSLAEGAQAARIEIADGARVRFASGETGA